MRVIVCPKCGVKNSIPEATDPARTYRCGKCGTSLSVATKITNRQEAIRASPKTLERCRQGYTRINKAMTSYFPLTSVLNWFKIRENRLIFSLVLLALLLHLVWVPYTHSLLADERYYVPEARSIIHERTSIGYSGYNSLVLGFTK